MARREDKEYLTMSWRAYKNWQDIIDGITVFMEVYGEHMDYEEKVGFYETVLLRRNAVFAAEKLAVEFETYRDIHKDRCYEKAPGHDCC